MISFISDSKIVVGVQAKAFLYSYKDKNKIIIRNWKLRLITEF